MKTIKFKENHEVRKGFFLLVFALLCNLGVSAVTFTLGGLKYTTRSSSTVSVSRSGSLSVKLVIPATVEYDGTQYSVTHIENSAFKNYAALTEVVIPNSVTTIGNSAFSGCVSLTTVTIGNSVETIGDRAFYDCSKLTAINVARTNTVYLSKEGILFNKSQTELIKYPAGKQGAFTIPNSVTTIRDKAFELCRYLTSVTIGNSVETIGDEAFYDCSMLTAINVVGTNTAYSSKDGILFNKSQTKLIQYPAGKQGGVYTIPNSVTSIGGSAFYSCGRLTSVTIPNSVTTIGNSAFYGCSWLTEINCRIEEPLTINSNVFTRVSIKNCTLHVPIGSKEKYEVADVWKEFNIVEDLPTGIVSIDNSQLMIDNDVWHTLNGVRLNGKPTKAGVYIVNGKAVVIK